eukprot:6557196-Prymnesium_polylepis.2
MNEAAVTRPRPSRMPPCCTKDSFTVSYVDSCTADATMTRGANAESPRKKPGAPSVRQMESAAPPIPPDSECWPPDWKRVLRMKNGLEASAARPPEKPARPRDVSHLRKGVCRSTPVTVLAVAYTPNRTDTLENCHRQDGPSPRCKPARPSVRPIHQSADSGFPNRESAPPSPCSVMRVFTTSTGLVKQIAPTAEVPAIRNSAYHGLVEAEAAAADMIL